MRPDAMPDLSVLIVAFNNAAVLVPCLESIYASPPRAALEVIVIDNGSADGTVGRVRGGFPEVRLLEAGYNAGFTGGNNLGLAQARGRYVLFLNPDTVVLPGALDALVDRADRLPNLGALGPKVLNPDGSLQHSLFRSPRLSDFFDNFMLTRAPGFARWFGYLGYTEADYRREGAVDAVCGCALFSRRDLLQRIGAFDEEYFIYFEEADLCQRIRNSGYTVYYTPAASVVHIGGATTRRHEIWCRIQAERSRRRFFEKHRSSREVAALRPLLFCSSLFRLVSAIAAVVMTAGLSRRLRRKPLNELAVLGWQVGLVDHGPKPT